eukprot:766061-Hanusia_phi.AAC.7
MEFEVHSNQRRGEEVQEESAWKLSPDQTQKLSAFFTRSTALTSEIVDDLRVFHEECQEIPMQLGLSSDVFIEKRRSSPTFEQFCQSLCREWEIRCKQHFLEKLSQASIIRSIAEGIPAGSPDNPLLFVQCTTMKDIAKWCQGTLVSKLTASFSSIKGLLEGEDEASSLLQRSSEAVNGKFCVAEFGKLEEFHKGLLERVGYPSLNFYEGMRQEHSEREDSEERFTTPNYLLETSPAQEWRVVTEEEERVQACQGRRRVRSVEELMSEEIVVRAKLRKEEILALILYTGESLLLLLFLRLHSPPPSLSLLLPFASSSLPLPLPTHSLALPSFSSSLPIFLFLFLPLSSNAPLPSLSPLPSSSPSCSCSCSPALAPPAPSLLLPSRD